MNLGDGLIIAIVVLQIGATAVYTVKGSYYEAVLWLGAGLGNIGYLLMRFKGA